LKNDLITAEELYWSRVVIVKV